MRCREREDYRCQYWHSRDCMCLLLDSSQESLEEWLDTKSSEFTATVESTLSKERSCSQLNTFLFGLTSEMQSILTVHILSLQMTSTTNHLFSTLACKSSSIQNSRVRSPFDSRQGNWQSTSQASPRSRSLPRPPLMSIPKKCTQSTISLIFTFELAYLLFYNNNLIHVNGKLLRWRPSSH